MVQVVAVVLLVSVTAILPPPFINTRLTGKHDGTIRSERNSSIQLQSHLRHKVFIRYVTQVEYVL